MEKITICGPDRCNVTEDSMFGSLSWLLEAEDHLLSLNSLGQKHLDTVKSRFYNHEDFMLELKSHQSAVGEVSEAERIKMIDDILFL